MAAAKGFSSVEYTTSDVWGDVGPDWLSQRTPDTAGTMFSSNRSSSESSIGAPPGLDLFSDDDNDKFVLGESIGDLSQISTEEPHSPRSSEDSCGPAPGLEVPASPVVSAARAARKANSAQRFEKYEGPVTTWMIRNIPCRFTQDDMMKVIDSHGFAGTYDFFYMPSASRNSKVSASSFGYGFINFSDPGVCGRFQQTFHGYRFEGTVSTKVCDIQPAHLQGLEPNIQCFHGRSSRKGFQPFIRRSCVNTKKDRANRAERAGSRRETGQKTRPPMADCQKMRNAPPGVWAAQGQGPIGGPMQQQGCGGYSMVGMSEVRPQRAVITL